MDTITEIWKDITIEDNKFAGIYQISNLGRVKSLPKQSGTVYRKERIIKPFIKNNGYLQVTLHLGDFKKHYYLHRLVAIHFIENNDVNKTCVNHLDENRSNNIVTNLEWCTYKENNDYSNIPQKVSNYRKRKINQLNSKGEIIKTWDSQKDACEYFGKDRTYLQQALKHGKEQFGYYWSYAE